MRYFLLALLAWSCLLTRPASAQAIKPLRPLVVRLDSGAVLTRPLIGLDPAAYQAVRLGQASDEQLLLVQATRLRQLVRGRRADSLAFVRQAQELRASRLDVGQLNGQLTQSEQRNRKLLAMPPQKPLLLDGNTYKGIGIATVVYLLGRYVAPLVIR